MGVNDNNYCNCEDKENFDETVTDASGENTLQKCEKCLKNRDPGDASILEKRLEYQKKKEKQYQTCGRPRPKFKWQKIISANRKIAKEQHNKLLDKFGPAYNMPKYVQVCDIPNYYNILYDNNKNMANIVQFL